MKRKYSDIVLPEPSHSEGYTAKELGGVLTGNNVDPVKFWKYFGVNTCILCSCCHETIYYERDVINAFRKMDGKKGFWD